MPDREILAYYAAIAPLILPFLRGRRVAIRHTFGQKRVFRRHPRPGSRRWIYIRRREELLAWVRLHGYEYFPHLRGSGGDWFGLDIDFRALPWKLGIYAVIRAAEIFQAHNIRFLLKYSGANGFHFMWRWQRPQSRSWPGGSLWRFSQQVAHALHVRLEESLQRSPRRGEYYRYLPARDPITEDNAADRVAQHSILIDELILKRMATMRAPWSLHMKKRWVSVPVNPQQLPRFIPARHATMQYVMRNASRATMPFNSLAKLRRFIEIEKL
jgi:DNA primase